VASAISSDELDGQIPTNGTPLYDVIGKAYRDDAPGVRPGQDQRHRVPHRRRQRRRLFAATTSSSSPPDRELQAGSEGAQSRPVRVFTISFGDDADTARCGRSPGHVAAHYDASNPTTIEQVFTNVISNF
jgi:Ca-activated chloride channel homolog